MAVFELYSMRNKPKYPDVYQYQVVPERLRSQITQIIRDTFGQSETSWRGSYSVKSASQEAYEFIFGILSKSYGEAVMRPHAKGSYTWLQYYLYSCSTEQFIDVLELLCRYAEKVIEPDYREFKRNSDTTQNPVEAIEEINEWMKRNGFGFEYVDGVLIKVDEQYIHAEVVKPALFILQDFEGAKEEFLSAHEHYRHGNFEECITDCCKSFESLMKAICHEKGWIDDKEHDKLPAAKLIQKCIENELVPVYMQNQFTAFKQLLESGVPTVRNKTAGHGTGKEVREIPQGLVSYTLHLTATNIVFLGNCYHEMK